MLEVHAENTGTNFGGMHSGEHIQLFAVAEFTGDVWTEGEYVKKHLCIPIFPIRVDGASVDVLSFSVYLPLFHKDALNAFDGGVRQILGPKGTAGIWATYPQPYLSIANGFADQVECNIACND